jgi:acetate kinase
VNTAAPPTDDRDGQVPEDLTVLALNSGSSSLKFGLYRIGAAGAFALLSGEAEAIGESVGRLRALRSDGAVTVDEHASMPDQDDAVMRIGRLLADTRMPAPAIIGHRIVHGGPALRRHCLIDASVLRSLEAAAAFAPLHTPTALQVIRFAQTHFPSVPQAVCFDTTFHAEMPEAARVLPIARDLSATGVQRYGFHGLSCESIVRQLDGGRPERLIIAHLGAGASVTAVRRGKSIDTSMGLTPTGGVIMATRSGDLDPGVLIYLMRERGFDAGMIEDLVDRRSGLLGISGVSGDMRTLEAAAASERAAALAVEMFRASVAKQLAAMITTLDGVDLIVFTGGIGENDAAARAAICARLSWIGIQLDAARNDSAANPISAAQSRCAVLVLPSREDEEIARHASSLFRKETQRA